MRKITNRSTLIDAGVVDVVVLSAPQPARARRAAADWRVLTLRRAAGVRCTGAWELVHGSIEQGENPSTAARREVLEETGLPTERLYSIAVNPFYLHATDTVQMAIAFAAIVAPGAMVRLSAEHDASRWCSAGVAARRLCWPREQEMVRHALHLLRSGSGGVTEDVLRVG